MLASLSLNLAWMTVHFILSFLSSSGSKPKATMVMEKGFMCPAASCPQVHSSPICVVLTWFQVNKLACAMHTARGDIQSSPGWRTGLQGCFSTYLKETCAFESPLRTQVLWVEVAGAPNFRGAEAAVCSLISSSHPQVIPVTCPSIMKEKTFRSQHKETDHTLPALSHTPYPCPRVVRKCQRAFFHALNNS